MTLRLNDEFEIKILYLNRFDKRGFQDVCKFHFQPGTSLFVTVILVAF